MLSPLRAGTDSGVIERGVDRRSGRGLSDELGVGIVIVSAPLCLSSRGRSPKDLLFVVEADASQSPP
jgi:predicted RecB family endonuclease